MELSELVAQHLRDLAERAVRVGGGDEALEQVAPVVAGRPDGGQLDLKPRVDAA